MCWVKERLEEKGEGVDVLGANRENFTVLHLPLPKE